MDGFIPVKANNDLVI